MQVVQTFKIVNAEKQTLDKVSILDKKTEIIFYHSPTLSLLKEL